LLSFGVALLHALEQGEVKFTIFTYTFGMLLSKVILCNYDLKDKGQMCFNSLKHHAT
jgi:hypothetical protein